MPQTQGQAEETELDDEEDEDDEVSIYYINN